MKKILSVCLAVLLLGAFSLFALGSGESSSDDQGSGSADKSTTEANLGEYQVEILSCRLAKDYADKPVVIVKYSFTNNADESTSFFTAFADNVYQNGVGLNESYILDDSANYDAGNQTKDIKTGATIEVEVAYELNDTTTDIEVEVEELISFSDSKVTKTFSIQ